MAENDNSSIPDSLQTGAFSHTGFNDAGHAVGQMGDQQVAFGPNGVTPFDGPLTMDSQGRPIPPSAAGTPGAPSVTPEGYVLPPAAQPGSQSNPGDGLGFSKQASHITVQKGTDLGQSPDVAAEGAANELKGLHDAAAVGQKQAVEKASFMDQAAKEQQEQQAKDLENERSRQDRLSNDSLTLQNSIADLSKQKLDPNRIFKERGTAGTIIAGISLIFGGIAQGMNGGTNTALDAMNAAIDRDIDAQKQDFQKAKDITSANATLFSHNMQMYNDERSAEAATRTMLWSTAQRQMEAMAAKYDPDLIGAGALKAKGALEQQVAKTHADFMKERQDKISIETTQAPMTIMERNKGIADLKEEVNKDEDLKMYGNQLRGLMDFESYKKNGRAGAAVISMLSDEFMKGGRFSESLGAELSRGAAMDKAKDYLATAAGHPEKSPVLQQFEQAMKDRIMAYHQAFGPKLNDLHQRASQLGVDPRAVFNADVQPLTRSGLANGDKKVSQ